MPRNKANKKSGWKKKDKKYRLEQNAKAKANRLRRDTHAYAAANGLSYDDAVAALAAAGEASAE